MRSSQLRASNFYSNMTPRLEPGQLQPVQEDMEEMAMDSFQIKEYKQDLETQTDLTGVQMDELEQELEDKKKELNLMQEERSALEE